MITVTHGQNFYIVYIYLLHKQEFQYNYEYSKSKTLILFGMWLYVQQSMIPPQSDCFHHTNCVVPYKFLQFTMMYYVLQLDTFLFSFTLK